MAKTSRKLLQAFGIQNLGETLLTYNPWWKGGTLPLDVPPFKREAYDLILKNLEASHGLGVLINGPRRVGKTTLINQTIKHLIENGGINPARILFFALDDPLVQQLAPKDQGAFFEEVLKHWSTVAGTALRTSPNTLYCFLDEIQKLPQWELYLKRYIDLHYPIKFVISGSASHTIFRRSLESLLGRLIEIKIPPFSFREYVRFHYPEEYQRIASLVREPADLGEPAALLKFYNAAEKLFDKDKIVLWNTYADAYAKDGGFPQLWSMPNEYEKATFVDTQFVQRVTLEDLRLIKEVRRPEIFHQFLRYVFARTGQEYNLEEVAQLIHTSRATLTEALPLLLQTELIKKVERYSGKPVRLRSTHAKLYVVDLTLSHAVTKISSSLLGQNRGLVSETLVHNMLRLISGVAEIMYYREPRGEQEIDFIVRIGSSLVPIEVCYQESCSDHLQTIKQFISQRDQRGTYGILVTKNQFRLPVEGLFEIPLPTFLLLA